MTLFPISLGPIPSGGTTVAVSSIMALRGLPRWRLRWRAIGLAARLLSPVAAPRPGALATGGGVMAIIVALCFTIDPLAESNANTMYRCGIPMSKATLKAHAHDLLVQTTLSVRPPPPPHECSSCSVAPRSTCGGLNHLLAETPLDSDANVLVVP